MQLQWNWWNVTLMWWSWFMIFGTLWIANFFSHSSQPANYIEQVEICHTLLLRLHEVIPMLKFSPYSLDATLQQHSLWIFITLIIAVQDYLYSIPIFPLLLTVKESTNKREQERQRQTKARREEREGEWKRKGRRGEKRDPTIYTLFHLQGRDPGQPVL